MIYPVSNYECEPGHLWSEGQGSDLKKIHVFTHTKLMIGTEKGK